MCIGRGMLGVEEAEQDRVSRLLRALGPIKTSGGVGYEGDFTTAGKAAETVAESRGEEGRRVWVNSRAFGGSVGGAGKCD